MYYVGLDLGQRSDYTALAVVEAPVFAKAPVWTVDQHNRAVELRAGWMSPAAVRADGWEHVRIARPADRQVYALRHLQRYPLGTPYPDIVKDVYALLSLPPLPRMRRSWSMRPASDARWSMRSRRRTWSPTRSRLRAVIA
jgi:hypothetical protein